MNKKIPLLFFSFIVLFSLHAQQAVYQLPVSLESKIINPTFFYTLPKTAFKADVVLTKTSNVKGIYADFAEKMLGITNYCKKKSVSYKLKSINVTTFVLPDEDLQFVVELSSAQMKNNFLQSLFQNKAADFHTVATVKQNDTDFLPDFFTNFADVILQQKYETYIEMQIVDGVETEMPVTISKITTKTLEQQAKQSADFIEKIREDRYAILAFAQETTLPKESFEYLVNKLNELEKKYLELFVGITVSEDIHETVAVCPKNDIALLLLCSISPDVGFSQSRSTNEAYNYYLQCTPNASLSLQVSFRDANNSYNPKQKFGYRIRKAIPTSVSLVHLEEKELLGIFPVYQFGLLETLPPGLDGFEIGKWGFIY
jgi:hypothetical protein